MLDYHWIPEHRDWSDREWLVEQRPRFVKVVGVDQNPPQVEDVLACGAIGYIYRSHPLSENFGNRNLESLARAAEIGHAHAEYYRPANGLLLARGLQQGQIYFEGLNEPQLWTAAERPAWVAAYYKAFLEGLHTFGARGVAGCFGVGWPNNDGPDTPPNWTFFEPVFDTMITSGSPYHDYLGVHEYWGFQGPEQMWGWWAGRVLQCNANVPILVTECGIDSHVFGHPENLGWQSLPPPERPMDDRARTYVDELWRYMERMACDPRVQGIFPFSYDESRQGIWWTFDIRNDVWKQALREKRAAEGMPAPGVYNPGTPPPPPPPPPPPDRAKGFDCSSWQGDINWEAVSEDFSMVFIRASAGLTPDVKFARNWDAAGAKGLLRGAYHYLRQDQQGQAALFASVVQGCEAELGYWADIEDDALTADKCALFLTTADARLGQTVHIYTSASKFDRYGTPAWVAGRKLWVAHWGATEPHLPDAWDEWEFWQYSNQGEVAGQRMDLDCYNGTAAELRAEYGGEEPPPPDDWLGQAIDLIEQGRGLIAAGQAILVAHQ